MFIFDLSPRNNNNNFTSMTLFISQPYFILKNDMSILYYGMNTEFKSIIDSSSYVYYA